MRDTTILSSNYCNDISFVLKIAFVENVHLSAHAHILRQKQNKNKS
jgi:hypothetical protein